MSISTQLLSNVASPVRPSECTIPSPVGLGLLLERPLAALDGHSTRGSGNLSAEFKLDERTNFLR